MRYTVREVGNAREFRLFYQFQNRLYRDCPTYVPSLDYDQRHTLAHSPCLDYCRQQLLLCFDEAGRVAGRCCAIINPRYNERYGTRRMRFGWTDFIEDFEAARALLTAAEEWGRSQGMTEIHGPLGYNTMYKQGLVVEGFDSVPQSNNLYNFPYYKEYLERLGYGKEADWLQYRFDATQPLPERLQRLSEMLLQRYGLRIADIGRLKKDKDIIARFFKEYNAAFRPCAISSRSRTRKSPKKAATTSIAWTTACRASSSTATAASPLSASASPACHAPCKRHAATCSRWAGGTFFRRRNITTRSI